MKKVFATTISILLLAVMVFHIPHFSTIPEVGNGIELCSDLEEDIVQE